MTPATQMTLALVMTNAGGEGKSVFAETLAALGRFAGLDLVVVDVDPGHRGYLNRNGDMSALSLDWSPKGDNDASAPADPEVWFEQHLAGRKLAILDTGANMLAAANPINRFMGSLIQTARNRGARVIIYGVTSPNKAGSDELIEQMYQRFHRGAEIVVVQNDRDGSNTFDASLAGLGTPIINLPHFEPGLQALRLRRRIPLDEVLTRPEPGYERATALIAKQLLAVAGQEAIVHIVGNEPARALSTLSASAPVGHHYIIRKLSKCSNTSIATNEEVWMSWRKFHRADRKDDIALLEAARELHLAIERYH